MERVSRFSARTGWDTAETSYAAAVREARASGRRIYDLTVSNPTRCGFAYDAEALLRPLADARALIYDPDPRGMRSAREAVASYYADHWAVVSPDDLILTTSTSEGYSFLFRLLCDPGDEVLVPQPSYPLFDFLATLDDVRLRPYTLFYDHGWWIDFDRLESSIGPRTRAILVVHPNNPTGHWTNLSERDRLEELCARHGLALIVDEVFLDYPLDASAPLPRTFAHGPHPVLTFVLSGLSKICGLPQMKAAWLAALGPETARASALARLEIVADTFLSMNVPIQLAMPIWLAHRGAIQGEILARARGNLAVLESCAEASAGGVQVLRAEAGWSAVVSLPGCVGEHDCAERLVRERGVVLHPGGFYGMADSQRVVVSLIGAAEELAEGIRVAIA
jgi:aspartate/methionine/tyrosine aminotransferase